MAAPMHRRLRVVVVVTALTLVMTGKPFTSNDERKMRNPFAVQAMRKATHARVLDAVDRQLPMTLPDLDWPVDIVIADECATGNLRDVCAVAPEVKAILDALTIRGLWPDDGPKFLGSVTFLAPIKSCDKTDRLTLTITPAVRA